MGLQDYHYDWTWSCQTKRLPITLCCHQVFMSCVLGACMRADGCGWDAVQRVCKQMSRAHWSVSSCGHALAAKDRPELVQQRLEARTVEGWVWVGGWGQASTHGMHGYALGCAPQARAVCLRIKAMPDLWPVCSCSWSDACACGGCNDAVGTAMVDGSKSGAPVHCTVQAGPVCSRSHNSCRPG